jgi:hypothetical protein
LGLFDQPIYEAHYGDNSWTYENVILFFSSFLNYRRKDPLWKFYLFLPPRKYKGF